MKQKATILFVCAVVLLVACPALSQPVVIWHDPWLNWDFQNLTGQLVNDFAIIVDKPNWDPCAAGPGSVLTHMPFPTFFTQPADYDGDGIFDDTMCKWSGADVPAGGWAHGGMWMLGSGMVLDAFWTKDCNKVGKSTEITYEQTRIIWDPEEIDPDVTMQLNIAPGFFEDPCVPAGAEAGWTEIRTFVNIPADELDLEDLNRDLVLDALSMYEVQPIDMETGLPIALTDEILRGDPDSFFDVFLANVLPEYATEEYEALLHAKVISSEAGTGPKQFGVIGEFWNLNPQSPEPGTMALLALGGALALIRRRRRR